MTTKRMEEINRKTRILRSLLAGECKYAIALRERVTAKYIEWVGKREAIQYCNHAGVGYKCVKPTS